MGHAQQASGETIQCRSKILQPITAIGSQCQQNQVVIEAWTRWILNFRHDIQPSITFPQYMQTSVVAQLFEVHFSKKILIASIGKRNYRKRKVRIDIWHRFFVAFSRIFLYNKVVVIDNKE
jgi:hypothetical protein